MVFSKHANTRKQQRGFTDPAVEIIQQYGRWENVPGGAIRFFFGEKEYRRAVRELKGVEPGRTPDPKRAYRKTIRILDRAKGGSMIIKEGLVLTLYK